MTKKSFDFNKFIPDFSKIFANIKFIENKFKKTNFYSKAIVFKEFCKKYFLKIKNTKVYNFLSAKVISVINFFKESFQRSKQGEESLNKMLLVWGLLPFFVFITTNFRVNSFSSFLFFFYLLFFVYLFLLSLYFISKAIKAHPEYNKTSMEKKQKKEHLNSLDKAELKEFKEKERKDKAKSLFKKALLLEAWKNDEFYKIVRLCSILGLLMALKDLFRFIK